MLTLQNAVEKSEDKELQLELERINKGLQERGQLTIDTDFDTYLFYPMGRPRMVQDKYKSRRRSFVDGPISKRVKRPYKQHRPNLKSSDEYISL